MPIQLAIPPIVGTTSTGDGFSYSWKRNSEFCVAGGDQDLSRLEVLAVNLAAHLSNIGFMLAEFGLL